jgi:ABC-type lipoprotein export system ATPase subunit
VHKLSLRDVSFGYGGGAPVLDGLYAEFEGGEVVGIAGPSGRGKSTLLYLLGLMLKPNRGAVAIDDRPVSGWSDARRAHLRANYFGFVFQDAALDPTRSVLDNVVEGALYRGHSRRASVRGALELLERFDVLARAGHRPGQISGGQAQRIALCRALLNSPPILLADEPTGNLDRVSAAVVVGAFRQHADAGNTVVVVTHDPFVLDGCDRRIQL